MKICGNIYAVGAVDERIRMFHGYRTPIGTTYNAYLAVGSRVTLIDFVKRPFADVLLSNIKAVLGERKIEYIICNHAEPDHSGALPEVLKAYPDAALYGTAACEKTLKAYCPETEINFNAVKTGDVLDAGEFTFTFIPMPMVHWPDSMATYMADEKMLFPNDALGQHIGTGEVFDSDLSLEKLFERAGDYYANIVLPFSAPVKALLKNLNGFEIKTVCPSHGVILKDALPRMLEKYAAWSDNVTDGESFTVIYDTMWGTTKKMAERIFGDYTAKGFKGDIINLSEKHHSYAMARLLESKYIFIGSPTLNNGMMPSVSAFLTYMKGLKPKNRIGRAFGSYGWSGEAVPQIHDILSSCGFEMMEPEKVLWNF